ncbi:MAG: four helix bundle protein [Phycisphaeraceae bacterium]|nr:MAG: four helix bundle protein [Phycisphaeraceae bacterium]
MAGVKTFRDLVAWQRGMALARAVYQATGGMPDGERFGLTNQMRRAAVSIPSNIAEGYGRESRPDLVKFLRIARGSLNELATQHELATSLGMIEPEGEVPELIEETDRVLQALIRSLIPPKT